jgi:predicted N-acetyltransferase YhbS
LADGLVLRTASDEQDVARVAEFNGTIHGSMVATMTYNLFIHHPHTQIEDLIFVEDEQGRVVSSLCLIPWTWRYEGVDIPAGEMGIVGTLESYRHQGLIRSQVRVFKRRLRERGCLLSHIQGIPYYYRQFGYEYALPLEGGLRLETRHVPEPPGTSPTFRLATLDDLPALMQLYDEAAQGLNIHTARDEATWRYLLTHTDGTEMERDVRIVENAGERLGYLCLPKHHFGQELVVNEASPLGFDAAIVTLDHLKRLVKEQGQPGIRLNLPPDCMLMRLARSLGAHELDTYAWQIHVPDVLALLRTLTPALERRIAQSPFAEMTRDVRLSLYRETLLLRFVEGELAKVVNLGFTNDAEVSIPPQQFTQLLLGHRTVEELSSVYPDVRVAPAWRLLIDTLFPKTTAFLSTIY